MRTIVSYYWVHNILFFLLSFLCGFLLFQNNNWILSSLSLVVFFILSGLFSQRYIKKYFMNMKENILHHSFETHKNSFLPKETLEINHDLAELLHKNNEYHCLKLALDATSSNVMVANEKGIIIYCNPSMVQTFKMVENDIRKSFPTFNAEKLIGVNFDIFHKNPDMQRRAVEGLRTTHNATIQVSDCDFGLIANPIFSHKGARLGTVVEWKNVTTEKKIESEITSLLSKITNGDLTYRIDVQNKQGFMKTLSAGINQITDNIENIFKDISLFLENLSKGDLKSKINKDYQGIFEEIKINANNTSEHLEDIIYKIVDATGRIAGATEEIASGANDLSLRTEQQAADLEETVASMDELTNIVKQNSNSAQEAHEMTRKTLENAEDVGKIAADATVAMENIQESTKKITSIINIIDEIAFQTNLLALNASVEAARAGDLGRGFAVVAGEVRSLAEHSAQSSRQIRTLIESSNVQVTEGSSLVQQAGHALIQIVDSIKGVSNIVYEIASSSKDQSMQLEQLNNILSQIDETTQKNAVLSTESVVATNSLDDETSQLQRMVEFFKSNSIH